MDIEDVEKLADLAKIELNEGEKKNLLSDMEGILGYVKQIQEVDVADVELEYSNRNVWRKDELAPREFSHEKIISQFPDFNDGFVKVKKIL